MKKKIGKRFKSESYGMHFFFRVETRIKQNMKYQFNGTDSEDFCHAIWMIYGLSVAN